MFIAGWENQYTMTQHSHLEPIEFIQVWESQDYAFRGIQGNVTLCWAPVKKAEPLVKEKYQSLKYLDVVVPHPGLVSFPSKVK